MRPTNEEFQAFLEFDHIAMNHWGTEPPSYLRGLGIARIRSLIEEEQASIEFIRYYQSIEEGCQTDSMIKLRLGIEQRKDPKELYQELITMHPN